MQTKTKRFFGFDPNKKTEKEIKRYLRLLGEEINLTEEEKEAIKKKILKNHDKIG